MISLRAVKLHRTHLRLRMPFRYGIATLTELPHVILAFTFEIDGRVATGSRRTTSRRSGSRKIRCGRRRTRSRICWR